MLRVILIIVSVLLILISLLQGGKSDGLSAFTGSSDLGLFQNMKERSNFQYYNGPGNNLLHTGYRN